jgi:hydroxymethylbilane synthase
VVTPVGRVSPALRIGSRGSALALWQAEHVALRLRAHRPDQPTEIVVIRTTGDRITDVPLSRIGDRGLFTRELDRSLLDAEIDLAVHSLKDLPTRMTEGLALAAVLERADARDALVVAPGRPARLADLPISARVGTSSLRRRAQLLALRPDLLIEDLRGNLDTRLQRVADQRLDAALLALAGLQRLGWEQRVAEVLDTPGWLPAAGQGALAVLTRVDDESVKAALGHLDHAPTRAATSAERAFLGALEGGCQIPIGTFGHARDLLELHGLVASVDGTRVLRGMVQGRPAQATQLGQQLADHLLAQGAGEILREIRSTHPPLPAAP